MNINLMDQIVTLCIWLEFLIYRFFHGGICEKYQRVQQIACFQYSLLCIFGRKYPNELLHMCPWQSNDL